MIRVAIFAGGTGTNAKRLIEYGYETDAVPFKPVLLLSDKAGSGAVSIARGASLPVVVVTYRRGREAAEEKIFEALDEHGIDLVVLAGYMRILSKRFVSRYSGRILNIHPSLLPSYPGVGAIEQSFASNDVRAGVTVHLVDAGVDTGPIVAQASFARASGMTAQAFEARIHEIEHALYPVVVHEAANRLENGLAIAAVHDSERVRSAVPEGAHIEAV